MRINFLIDGFNLYHSIKSAHSIHKVNTKWLDVKSLFTSYLHLFGKAAVVNEIHYFSALPYHLTGTEPGKLKRHQTYIDCLFSMGVHIHLGRFKKKDTYCTKCGQHFKKHEEKETDVAIAIKALEMFYNDECEVGVIVSGDTDFAPVAKACQLNFPTKKILFAFPYGKQNAELKIVSPESFKIHYLQYSQHQLPNPYINGTTTILKPVEWI